MAVPGALKSRPVPDGPPHHKPPEPPPAIPDRGGTANQRSAIQIIRAALHQYGLGSLGSWAWEKLLRGESIQQILGLEIYNTQAFNKRFPAYKQLAAEGRAISPADYIALERGYSSTMRQYGLPPGMFDKPDDFAKLIVNGVSATELSDRLTLYSRAANEFFDPEKRSIAQRDLGVSSGDLLALFLDPRKAQPLLERRFAMAQIGVAAHDTGYGSSRGEDRYLAGLGVSEDQARQGFNQLVGEHGLFRAAVGTTETGIGRSQQLAAEFGGNANAQMAIQRRLQQRQAAFAGSAGYASGSEGIAGIGSASGA